MVTEVVSGEAETEDGAGKSNRFGLSGEFQS
jgi:hypothetical protein